MFCAYGANVGHRTWISLICFFICFFFLLTKILVASNPDFHRNTFSYVEQVFFFFLFFFCSWCVDLEKKRVPYFKRWFYIIRKNKNKITSFAWKKQTSVIFVHFPVLVSFCLDGAQLYSFRCNACFQHKMGIFAW